MVKASVLLYYNHVKMQTILLGPAGIGPKAEVATTFQYFKENKIKAAEIPFTYSIFLSNEDSKEVGKLAKKYNISLSIHAPYWLNLNSTEPEKIIASKERVLKCCERAHHLKASHVVFHPGYYGKMEKEETYNNIKKQILAMQATIKSNNWQVKLAPETMGKTSVFGSLNDILNLVKATKCSCCIDFAHLKARNLGTINYPDILNQLKQFKSIHCHFSGIDYGEKGERKHIPNETKYIKELAEHILNSKINCTIISESPDPIKDTLKTIKVFEELGYKF